MSASVLDPGTQYTVKSNSVFNESGDRINLGIVYRNILSLLMSKRIGMINASVENRDSLKAGVAIYYINRRNISRDYTAGTSSPDTVSTRQVNVPLDQRKAVSYTYETLDLEQLGVKIEEEGATVSGAMITGWLESKAKSVEAYMYSKLLQLATKTTETLIQTTELPASPDLDAYRNLWDQISTVIYGKMNLINEEYIGLDFEDGALWVAPTIYSKLILATTNLGSDMAQRKLEEGMPSFTIIAGIKVIPAPFLGEQYSAGSIDTDEAFDFRGVTTPTTTPINAMWVHKQALAFPFNRGQENTFVLPSNGNIHNFHKFMVNSEGGVFLRKKAIIPFHIGQASASFEIEQENLKLEIQENQKVETAKLISKELSKSIEKIAKSLKSDTPKQILKEETKEVKPIQEVKEGK